jgi:integrase
MVLRVEKPKGYQRSKHPTPPREIGLDPKTQAIIDGWLEVRGPTAGLLFANPDGRAPSGSYVREQMAKLGRRAGLECRVHAHSLRHGFASELYRETLDIVLVSRALGHNSVATTAVYLNSIGANPEVVARTQARQW